MTREGITLAPETAQLLSTMFALLPVPVAILDDQDRVVLANSAFTEIFEEVPVVSNLCQVEIEAPGRGTFEVRRLPLNERGYKILCGVEVSDRTRLRRRVAQLERMAAIGEGVAGIAREIEVSGEPAAAKGAGRIEEARRQVESLLSLSRGQARYSSFDLNGLARRILQARRSGEALRITSELQKDLPPAIGDPALAEQVISALIANAEASVRRVARGLRSVHIRTCLHAGHVQLHVSDNGPGDSAYPAPPPCGPGLELCAELVKDMGGDLYAWNRYGSGSTYTLELRADMPPQAGKALLKGAVLRGKTVLMIDDDVHLTRLVHDAFRWCGAVTHVANSGSEAYEKLRSRSYDLIVCGRMFPGVTGQNLHRLLESWAPGPGQRFLFLMNSVATARSGEALSRAGVRFLRKPFRIQDLLEAAGELFNRNPRADF